MGKGLRFAHLALIVAGILFGANYWVAKSLMPNYLSPAAIIVFRTSGALILFAALLPFARKSKFSLKEWLLIALCGLSGVTVNQYLFFVGLNLSTPVETSLLHTISPIVVVLFAAWLIREKTSLIQIAGIAVGFSGAVLLTLTGKEISWSSSHLSGNLFILANISAYSVYLVLAKPLMKNHDPMKVTAYVFFFGWLFFLPVGVTTIGEISVLSLPPAVWASLAYVVIGTTFLTYLLTMLALKKLKAGTVGYYIYLQPIISGGIGIATGKEKIDLIKIISAILIFAGVFLVNWRSVHSMSESVRHTIKNRISS